MCILCRSSKKKSITYINRSIIHLQFCKYIKNIPIKLTNITVFNCSYSSLIDLYNLNHYNLKHLICNNTHITNVNYYIPNLIELNISNTKIKNLPNCLYNLKYLNISNTNITYISAFYKNLIYLNINNTKITKIYNYINLKKLLCKNSLITNIPYDLTNLEYLNCSFTNIKQLPNSLLNLKYLSCYNTEIKRLSKKYIKLLLLKCYNTNIYYIPKDYTNLIYLDAHNTYIKYLSYKLNDILYLNISNTLITKITLTNIIYLNISNTKINKLNTNLSELSTLICYNSNINHIPIELYNIHTIYPKCLNKININKYIDIIDFNNLSKYKNLEINKNVCCAICLDSIYNQVNIIYIKSCKHIFHSDCILNWYKIKLDCPCCRKKLFEY